MSLIIEFFRFMVGACMDATARQTCSFMQSASTNSFSCYLQFLVYFYCVRGQAEMRLSLHAAARIVHPQLRTQALQHTALSQAQPKTIIARLFKPAVRVRQCKNMIVLSLPSAYAVKHLLQTLTERAYLPTLAKILDSS